MYTYINMLKIFTLTRLENLAYFYIRLRKMGYIFVIKSMTGIQQLGIFNIKLRCLPCLPAQTLLNTRFLFVKICKA